MPLSNVTAEPDEPEAEQHTTEYGDTKDPMADNLVAVHYGAYAYDEGHVVAVSSATVVARLTREDAQALLDADKGEAVVTEDGDAFVGDEFGGAKYTAGGLAISSELLEFVADYLAE